MHPVSYDVDIRHDSVCGCTCESKKRDLNLEIDLNCFACFCDKIKIKNGL